jgi:hypothetical protein
MKVLILFSLIAFSWSLYAQEDDMETESLPVIRRPPHSSSPTTVPQLTPEQAKMILEKVKQGEKFQKEQHQALEELDEE